MFLQFKNIFIILILCIFSIPAFSQDLINSTSPIYRCGNSYSHKPCEGARVVDTTPLIENHDFKKRPIPVQKTKPIRYTEDWEQDNPLQMIEQRQIRQRKHQEQQNQKMICEQLRKQQRELQELGRRGGDNTLMDWLRERQRSVREQQRQHNCN